MIEYDLVDLVGIEPTTSSMPWKRAPQLPIARNGTDAIFRTVVTGLILRNRSKP